ncbi:MAG TPA: rod shape-determining protein MreD [Novosphingobium sp.]|nr:rod shape-determining protein MreD [Novosphingobium sp.]
MKFLRGAGSDTVRRRINRAPSPFFAHSVPWVSTMLGSILPTWIIIASAPVVPPLGFLAFLAWRQLRPGLLPIWAGLPLGLFDDLYSGQPGGSAVFLWSIAALVLELVETRFPWRNFVTEWLVAAAMIASYIVFSLVIANLAGASTSLVVIVPQIVVSILCYPLIGRVVAMLDRMRLTPIMELR